MNLVRPCNLSAGGDCYECSGCPKKLFMLKQKLVDERLAEKPMKNNGISVFVWKVLFKTRGNFRRK